MKLNNVVLFACNKGGHFSQMMGLKTLFKKYPSILLTNNPRANRSLTDLKDLKEIIVIKGTKTKKKEKGLLRDDNRLSYLSGYLLLFKECFRVVRRIKPKVIITTGSNIAVPTFIYGKLIGSKMIFIESRAHVYGKTLTGKLVARFSDEIIVQWPEMLKIYPNAHYYGTIV